MLTTSLLSTSALSATDSELLSACDKALNAKIQESSLCGLGVQLRTDEISRLSSENAQLRAKGAGFFDNPFIFAAIGVILGTYIGARATR